VLACAAAGIIANRFRMDNPTGVQKTLKYLVITAKVKQMRSQHLVVLVTPSIHVWRLATAKMS